MPVAPGRLVVLSPEPLLTITIEPGPDAGGEVHLHVGGQGVWIARLARRLDADVVLVASVAGESGHVVAAMIEREGVPARLVHGGGTNGAYVHDRRSGTRREVASMPATALDRHRLDDLYGAVLAAGIDAATVVLGGPSRPGVVPDHVYERLTADLRANGRRVVADLSGRPLRAVLAGGVSVAKASDDELVADGWADDDGADALVEGLRRLVRAGAGTAVVTRGADGALAHDGDRVLEVAIPRIEAFDERGAGDSFTAGLATSLARGDGLDDALRVAGAAGCLNVTRRGAGTGDRGDVEQLVPHVRVRER